MATTLDTLLVRIEADLSGLRKDLAAMQTQVNAAANGATSSFKKMEGSLSGVATVASGLKGIFGAFIGASLLGGVVNTIQQFQGLEAQLRAITKSAAEADAAFLVIQKFTATTVFRLSDVTDAFITLRNAGIAPTTKVLQDVGNLAAGRGKNITDVAQAILNATTGEMEMLKQLGIVAYVQGDKIAVTFQGTTELIGRSSDDIVNYIRKISQANFGTALEKSAATVAGAFSNLMDSLDQISVQIGKGGFADALQRLAVQLTDSSNGSQQLAYNIGTILGKAVDALGATIKFLGDHLKIVTTLALSFIAAFAIGKIVAIGAAVFELAVALKEVRTVLMAYETIGKKGGLKVIAISALVLAEQAGLLDKVMQKLGLDFTNAGDAVDGLGQSLDDANATIENSKVATLTQAQKDFNTALTDTTKSSNDSLAAAALLNQGWSQAFVDMLEKAKLLKNFTSEGGLIDPNSAEQFNALVAAFNQLSTSSAVEAVAKLKTSLSEAQYAASLDPLNKLIYETLGPEAYTALARTGGAFNQLAADIAKAASEAKAAQFLSNLKDQQAILEVTKSMGKAAGEVANGMGLAQFNVMKMSDPKGLQAIIDTQAKLTSTTNGLSAATEKYNSRISDAVNFAHEAFGDLNPMQAMLDMQLKLNEAKKAGKITEEEYKAALAKTKEEMQKMDPVYQAEQRIIDGLTSSMTDNLVALFSGTQSAADTFKNILQDLGKMILTEVLKMMIVIPLMNLIRAAFGMQPVAGGFNFSSLMGGGKAGGGTVQKGVPTIVGERGMEVFVPSTSGKIMNAQNTRNALGGGSGITMNQTIQVSTGVSQTVRAEMMQMLPRIRQESVQAVAMARQRSSSYAKVFGS